MNATPKAGKPLKLLLCCEFYHPSRGGVQEVMRQLAERFAAAGHDVTVATTAMPERSFRALNGVKIAEFAIWGNQVRGLEGEVERYRDFLRSFDGDAMLIKAAQQWTFDACWPALDAMACRKVFIPCGFSALYEPDYAAYFAELPTILAKFDSLIFYAEDYRDINFAREHGLTQLHLLPNGASETEFAVPPPPGIRARLGIPEEALLMITVGTPTSMKAIWRSQRPSHSSIRAGGRSRWCSTANGAQGPWTCPHPPRTRPSRWTNRTTPKPHNARRQPPPA